ncbi:hypothetical protein FBQ82_02845 [Anaerolineae bacterium CFX7]|nr:hypothetical protein [Anaerolineae bacterium CFX7]
METTSVKIELPKKMYRRLELAARESNQSIAQIVLQSLRGNLPPVFDDLPKPLRQEFSSLANFTDDELWAIAQRPPDPRAWRKHERLLELNATRDLNDKEAQELARLQEDMNQHVLKKSFALALLKWRGYAIPNRRRSQNDAT